STTLLTHDEIMARVDALTPLLKDNAQRTEEDRVVAPVVIDAMRDAGLFRLFVPRRFGGYELGFRTAVEAVSTISQTCSGSGWVLMVFTGHDWLMGMFPEQGQADVYRDGPDALLAGGLASQGFAEPVDGGWRVSGRWQFGSGCDYATWCIAGALVTTSDPDRPKHVHVVVPRSDFTIDDTWYTLGLRGSGSKDVLLKDVFVPARRSIATGALFRGEGDAALHQDINLYRLPVTAGLAIQAAAVVLGITRSALDLFVEQTKTATHKYTGESKAEKVGIQMRIAEAAAEIRSAGLLIDDVLTEFEQLVATGANPDLDFRVRTKWETVYAIQICRRALDRLYAAAGARAIFDTSPLQQAFRDINTAAHHATVDFDGAAEIYGRVALGLKPGSVLI
ncbi:MAG: acyl-CoA dehydrogenase family protein, partial [Dehalococcoidia bacterium]